MSKRNRKLRQRGSEKTRSTLRGSYSGRRKEVEGEVED